MKFQVFVEVGQLEEKISEMIELGGRVYGIGSLWDLWFTKQTSWEVGVEFSKMSEKESLSILDKTRLPYRKASRSL